MNMSAIMGRVLGSGQATLHELQTVYDSEDMLLMDEAAMVWRYNG
ncbi:hypothetical protein [Gluconobacter albidus]|uniref:Uncharacterized protein n=1 Tax=Gluconobacter albidus TaxID=318683 RepID=A0ABQ5X261_9PROT|nr:hypothetical protein [Gluconobacter albidus]GLQ69362.1 hypothetical protein GCM10007866_18130 [Gluconobacter albidus]